MPDDFPARLALARTNAGLNQRELAHKIGLHRTTITNLERGEASTTLEHACALAAALGVTVGWLVNGETALVPDELRSELRKVRDEWQRVADRNRAEGWPEQADRVHMPDRMAGQMARLLARTDPRHTRKRNGGTRG